MVCILFVFCAATAIASPADTSITLYFFGEWDGKYPAAGLVQASDGNFYGTTSLGGDHGWGTVFKITPRGTLTILHSFDGFDGGEPLASLVQASDGNFYGTTAAGGANCVPHNGCGTVFKITPGGTLTTLYTFCSQSGCADGAYPEAGLVQASDGNFYGTTGSGGAHGPDYYCPDNGCGTVFKITPDGTLTTLYTFCSQSDCADGAEPEAGLVQATDGNFYGTTWGGGSNEFCVQEGCGTVFKITPAPNPPWPLTTLYRFCPQGGYCADGANPAAGLVQATDGNFYGTTECVYGCPGTVFEITPDGALTTLHLFAGGYDGAQPAAGLVQATDGNFYGTTSCGGGGFSCGGTVFKITPDGALTTLHNFWYNPLYNDDGFVPEAALVQARDGKFYGTTYWGGIPIGDCSDYHDAGCGTVFSLDVGPSVSFSPTSLYFAPQGLTAPQNVTLTNTGRAPLLITSIVITGANGRDFDQWNNCPISPNTLAPGDHCTMTVLFAPIDTGTLQADVTVTDNAAGSPQMVPLTGIAPGGKVKLVHPQH